MQPAKCDLISIQHLVRFVTHRHNNLWRPEDKGLKLGWLKYIRNSVNVLYKTRRPLSRMPNTHFCDSADCIVNKFQHVRVVEPCTVRSKLNKFKRVNWGLYSETQVEHVWRGLGLRTLQGPPHTPPLWSHKQTWLKTSSLPLWWRSVTVKDRKRMVSQKYLMYHRHQPGYRINRVWISCVRPVKLFYN